MISPKRITNAAPSWIGNEYSSVNAFNADETMFVLVVVDHFVLVNMTTWHITTLPIGASQEPRWDGNLILYITANTIKEYDTATGKVRELYHFPEYIQYDPSGRNGIQGMGEGDIEGRYWALAGMRPDGKRDIFMFDIIKGSIGNTLTLDPDTILLEYNHNGRAHGFDNIYATPNGHLQIGWTKTGPDRFQGIELYDKDMNFLRQLATSVAHNDVGIYRGQDVLVFCTSNEPSFNSNSVAIKYCETGETRILGTFPWEYVLHISCCARDRCIVSTVDPGNIKPSQVLRVPFDGTGMEVFCNTDTVYRGYNSAPKASVSPTGTKILYSSNGGRTQYPDTYCDTYLLNLGSEAPAPPKPDDSGWKDIDFKPLENKEYRLLMKVVNGQLTVKMQEKG